MTKKILQKEVSVYRFDDGDEDRRFWMLQVEIDGETVAAFRDTPENRATVRALVARLQSLQGAIASLEKACWTAEETEVKRLLGSASMDIETVYRELPSECPKIAAMIHQSSDEFIPAELIPDQTGFYSNASPG